MRLFVALWLAVLAVSPVQAAVDVRSTELPDSLLLGTARSIARLGLKPPLRILTDRDCYVLYFAGAACGYVAVLARPTVDPQWLARQLDSACRQTLFAGETIEWGHSSIYSVAMVGYSDAHLGQASATAYAPVGKLMAGLRESGLSPHGILRIGRYAGTRGIVFSQRGSRNYNWYDISSVPNGLVVYVSAKVTRHDIGWLALCTFLAPAAILLSVLVAVAVSRTQRISVDRRHWLCPRIVVSFALVAMALQVGLVIPKCIRGPGPMAIGDLWSGSFRPSILVIIGMILAVFLALASFPIGRSVERKLFGPREDEEDVAEERREIRRYLLAYLGILGVLLVTGLILRALAPSTRPFLDHSALTAFISVGLMNAFMRWTMPEVWGIHPMGKADPELTARAIQIGERMGVKVRVAAVSSRGLFAKYPAAWVTPRGRIVVTRKLMEEFTPAELDCILAHEAAHLVGNSVWRRFAPLPFVLAVVAFPFLMTRTGPHQWAWPWWLVPLTSLLVIGGVGSCLSRGRELQADKLALQTTRDLASAESVLRKLREFGPSRKGCGWDGLSSHPKISTRIEHLREAASELGIGSE